MKKHPPAGKTGHGIVTVRRRPGHATKGLLSAGNAVFACALGRSGTSILKREGDRFYLVTPVEKVGIKVEDAPFVAIDFEAAGTGPETSIRFTTNVDEEVTAGEGHPIRVARDPGTGEPAPYVHVRSGLEALIDRKSFYRLVEIGQTQTIDGVAQFGVWSGGTFFPFIPAAELRAETAGS